MSQHGVFRSENEGNSARIHELKTTIAEGVIACEIRKRSARVQVLQNTLDRMCNLIEARAIHTLTLPNKVYLKPVKTLHGMKHHEGTYLSTLGCT
jgi:hypothetical protein